MKRIASLILFIMLHTFPFLCSGQQIWTLDMCIDYALEHNLEIEHSRITSIQTKNELTRSKLEYLPTLYGTGRVVVHPEPQFIPSVGISTVLFDGMRRYHNSKSLETSFGISEMETERIRNELAISVPKAYLEVLLSIELERVAQESYRTIGEQCLKQKILFESGKGTYSSLLEMESQKSLEKVELGNSHNVLSINLISLTHLMNLPFSEDFLISDRLMENMPQIEWSDIDKIYRSALSLPYIRSAELGVVQKGYDMKVASGGIFPTVSLDMTYLPLMDANEICLTVSIPIFNKGQTLTAVKNATNEYRKSEIELQMRHQELYKDIQHRVQEAISYYHEYMASVDRLNAARAAYETIREKFEVGLVSPNDYIRSRNDLYGASSQSIQAKYRYLFQIRILDLYQGEVR